jgi:hypothetical protein
MIVCATLLSALIVPGGSTATGADFSVSLLAGYKGGASVRGSLFVSRFAEGFPLALEGGVTYTTLDPGHAADARRIFVNDATNGTPEKSGHAWDFRLDFLYQVRLLGMEDAHVFAGARYSLFAGDFVFVGGNEDFEVESNQWGIGVGARASFPMGKRFSFTLLAGADYFFSATLTGHDTSYSPDGETINGKHDYSFSTADAAIHQPKLQPSFMIGISYGL